MVGEAKFKKYIWVVLGLFILATATLGYEVTKVRFDYDFEKFFPANDEETTFFINYRDKFSSDNDFLLISIESNGSIFNPTFLKEVADFTSSVEGMESVNFVNSITNQEEFFMFAGGATDSKPYIDFNDFDAQRDSARIFKNNELINTMVAKDAKSICLFVRHEDYISKKKSDALIFDLNQLIENHKFKKVRIAGRTIGQKYYIDKMTFEMALFVGSSAFLIVFFLFIAFRSGWGILIPQIVIFSSMVWVVGGMGVFNQPINIILSILPSIMFVVSMSDVIHLVSRYLDALREEDSVFKAITIAVKEVGMATFLTSVTTSIGFFSLYFVNVQPIRAFGIIMGFGVLIAFVLTFLTLPIMFYIFPGPKHIREKKKDHFWRKYLERAFLKIIRRKKTIFITTGLIMLISIVGLLRIETNNFLMDDLKPNEPLKVDFDFLDEHYGGIRPFELAVTVKDSSKTVWDKDVLEKIDTVEKYLVSNYGVVIKNSLVTALKVVNRSANLGNKKYYSLPKSTRKVRKYRRAMRIVGQGKFIKSIVDSTEQLTRITGSIPDLGNKAISAKNESFLKFINDENLNEFIEFDITGTAHLVDKNLKYLSQSLIQGLGVSILIVALIVGLIYRSGSILVISIVTNLIPLVFIAGVMGFLGVELKTSTSIIFTIAFGIAVDDTIHFLGKFKYELSKGKGKMFALKRSYLTTGKAMILTTLILCSGFMLLILSSFLGTFYMGLLLCITLFVALISDLTILPVMLMVFYKPKGKTQTTN
ncbi:MAG: MMPL family transporter [Crocinitomicaceae bacterium]|nr:MMPL family transporter [Crocinitomicaceae bacterium]